MVDVVDIVEVVDVVGDVGAWEALAFTMCQIEPNVWSSSPVAWCLLPDMMSGVK
jgi:hypothetical protein